jgi:hypothetical protein
MTRTIDATNVKRSVTLERDKTHVVPSSTTKKEEAVTQQVEQGN